MLLCWKIVRDGAGRRMSPSSRSGSSKPSREQKWARVQVYERTINTLTRQPLIGLLANRNVLPKYGFPTDTVELRTVYSGDPVGRKLELSRDLSAAIYEYAPGAEVVAGGKLWTSGRRVPAAGARAARELLRGVRRVLPVPGERRR